MEPNKQSSLFPTCSHFEPMDPLHQANPYPQYAALRREAAVFYDPKLDVWVVTRYADIMAVLKQPQVFSSSGSLSAKGMFSEAVQAVLANGVVDVGLILGESDGRDHTRIRSVINQSFTQKRIAAMEPLVRGIAHALVDEIFPAGRADLTSQFAVPLTGLAICDLVGFPASHVSQMKAWNEDWVTLLSGTASEQEQVRCAQGVLAYQRYLHEHFRDRQSNPRGDLLTTMLPQEWGGNAPLSPGEAIYNVIDSIVAGNEPTEKMITNAVATLFKNRPKQKQLLNNSVPLESVVEELLRSVSPVQGLFRVALREVELGGVTIPRDGRVFLVYASANHDEEFFANADHFDPSRPLTRSHLTFSHGIHVCLGAALARLEIRVALEVLQQRLPTLRPARDASPERLHHLWLHGFRTMPVEWDLN